MVCLLLGLASNCNNATVILRARTCQKWPVAVQLSGAEKAAPSDVEQPTDDENSGEGNAKRLSGTSHGAGGSVRKATKT